MNCRARRRPRLGGILCLALGVLCSCNERAQTAADTSSTESAESPLVAAESLEDDPYRGQPEGAPDGRWRIVPQARRGAGADLSEELEELMAIGYAAGTVESTEGTPSGVVRHDPERAHPGLNLMVSGHAPEAILMDMDGRPRHTWQSSFAEAFPKRKGVRNSVRAQMWRRAHLDQNGRLLAIYEGLGIVALDAASEILWAHGDGAHHDVDVDPEGRIYVLTREAGIVQGFSREAVLADSVTELDSGGRVVRKVSVLECLLRSDWAHTLDEVREAGGDVTHTNTCTWLDGSQVELHPAFARGNLLVSLRTLGLLAVIDLDERTVPWALAGPWSMQHQPVLLDSGNMLVFDNGEPEEARSSVLEFDPLTAEVFWSYDPDDGFFSRSCGSCQRLPNGNTLITETDFGRALEVDREGEIVWEFLTPHRAGDSGEFVASLFEIVRLDPASLGDWLE